MKRQLDELLDADLQKINHISENKHFIGFSKKLGERVFVKIFKDPLKYKLEYEVLRSKGNLLLLDFAKCSALVLKYEDYIPLNKESVNDEDTIKIAKLISDFHRGNWLEIENEKETSLEKVDANSLTLRYTPASTWKMELLPDSTIRITRTFFARDTSQITELYNKRWQRIKM